MPFGHKLPDFLDDDVGDFLEEGVELVDSPALGQSSHGDLVPIQAADEVFVVLEYFKGVPEDVVFVAAVALRVVLRHYVHRNIPMSVLIWIFFRSAADL